MEPHSATPLKSDPSASYSTDVSGKDAPGGAAAAPAAHKDEDETRLLSVVSQMWTDWNLVHVLYLSLFSTVGVTLRAFMGRFFGGDCETSLMGKSVDDWMWPVSRRVCITASGRTGQYGGALFLDLPANILGSFIMGFVTGHSSVAGWPAIPFLRHDHPLQMDTGLHVGVRTAVCGCLTTFSSWNAQMVLMMDGTANADLGSQIPAALFGYLLGLQAAIVSFHSGRTLSAWFQVRTNPQVFDRTLDARDTSWRAYHKHLHWIVPAVVAVLFGSLVGLYVAGDLYWGIAYYRQLWIACLVAPAGTILRWKLSRLNGRFGWFPVGTFVANILASIISCWMKAWSIVDATHGTGASWEVHIVKAVSLGVAGSLSTVSTFAKEVIEMIDKNPKYDKRAFYYSHGTMLSCCIVGLLVYSPMVRNS